MRELEYPFDGEDILQKSKRIRKRLFEEKSETGQNFLEKRIAVLGGSTTNEIITCLEIFLLNQGIEPTFYESEYNQYFEDAVFENEKLAEFQPEIVFVHTTNRNVWDWPLVTDTEARVQDKLDTMYEHLHLVWEKLREKFRCIIIQNNMELPGFRMLGNKDTSDIHGRVYFVNQINERICKYAREHENFYVNDILYQSSCFGLDKWADPFYWYMYKYAVSLPAIPFLSYNVANIIKSIYGKNKKALVLDLDNTLWGGVIGEDGVEGIELGNESAVGQAYFDFQRYIREIRERGILLTVCSKNESENAIVGLNHENSQLRPEDFHVIKANWEPKNANIHKIACELEILPESMVFVDDNPAERELVSQQSTASVAKISTPEYYIQDLDRSGYFEVTTLSDDDLTRNDMYKANVARAKEKQNFSDYAEYLKSLEMKAMIRTFEPMDYTRISQLTNKSNQFNLTTKRFSVADIENMAEDKGMLTLCGRLQDKFGDNGIVSVVIGRIENTVCHIVLWLMSCRVLKRGMEEAMMDAFLLECKKRGILEVKGYYYPTAKNNMVKDFYAQQGFTLEQNSEDGSCVWFYEIPSVYRNKNEIICMEEQ